MTLVYGGTNVGLMGTLADSVRAEGGRVVGVIPQLMVERGLADKLADELIVTDGMRERKAMMEQRADAFAVLPGGIGTLEEVAEIVTLKQLQLHTKPIVLLDIEGYYRPLARFLETVVEAKLAKPSLLASYYLAPGVSELFAHLEAYRAPDLPPKWF